MPRIFFALVAFASACPAFAQESTAPIVRDIIYVPSPKLTEDDKHFARLAFGYRENVQQAIDQERMFVGLNAIRATDRFMDVGGRIVEDEGETKLLLALVPWPEIKSIQVVAPPELEKRIKPWLKDLRKGTRLGNFAKDSWERRAEDWLKVWGYPEPFAEISRSESGDSIEIKIDTGRPDLIDQIDISDSSSLGAIDRRAIQGGLDRALKKLAKDKKNWPDEVQRMVVRRLNSLFAKEGHYFAKIDFSRETYSGKLNISIDAGPVVSMSVSGARMRVGQLRKLLNLPSADRFGEDLLFETDRRLAGKFRLEGRPFAEVWHTLTPLPTAGGINREQLRYVIRGADRLSVAKIEFEGNEDFQSDYLLDAAKINAGGFFSRTPKATSEFEILCRTMVENYYILKGYPSVRVNTKWLRAGKKEADLLITVDEGAYKELIEINIVMDIDQQNEDIIKNIFNFIDEKNSEAPSSLPLDFNPSQRDWIKSPIRCELNDNGYKLTMLDSTPFVRIHIADLISVIQHTLASAGVVAPRVEAQLNEAGQNGISVDLTIPQQNFERLRRIVIQGADRTKAEFIRGIMRPTDNSGNQGSQDGQSASNDQGRMWFGRPLVISRITATRTELGSFGIFRSVDASSVEEALGGYSAGPSPWQPGDMMFRLAERPVWNFSNSISYDRSVGYQFGIGAQRLNMLGKARTLDLNVLAGDGTINSSTLRQIFSTGDPSRSIDIYSIGYTDPWLPTGSLGWMLGNRALMRSEVAFIKERQNVYLIFHRRYTTSLEWRVQDTKYDTRTVRLGYRFENVGVNGPNVDEMQDQVRSPDRSLLSVPFAQFIRDTRDNPFDPKRGSVALLQLDVALQSLGTSANSSFVKADFRFAWNFPITRDARFGVLSLAVRLGAARPTASTSLEMPLSERFFAGGPNSHRGIEPDQLGPFGMVFERERTYPYRQVLDREGRYRYRMTPIGGQGIALVNLDYRFPLPVIGQWMWGELFIDSGEVYNRVREVDRANSYLPPFPHWRTSAGAGLILRLGGFPIKVEYAWDARRMLGKKDEDVYSSYAERTKLKNLLVSAGIQF
ncbi:MAG: BamA/TamA family outer membrane protein [Holophagaceae bacterium]|nr:BamA/TamA family outer membrane protein [Holophagaceae bacterium]